MNHFFTFEEQIQSLQHIHTWYIAIIYLTWLLDKGPRCSDWIVPNISLSRELFKCYSPSGSAATSSDPRTSSWRYPVLLLHLHGKGTFTTSLGPTVYFFCGVVRSHDVHDVFYVEELLNVAEGGGVRVRVANQGTTRGFVRAAALERRRRLGMASYHRDSY